MTTRSWTGIPSRLPRRLPPPVPELAFVLRQILPLLFRGNSPRRDYILSYIMHVSVLRRLPARRLLYNDVLFHIKTGTTLRRPLAIRVTDKELAKRHVAAVVGEELTVPTLAILKTPEDIDAFDFPARCIIKPTHASGEFLAREAGEPINKRRIKNWLKLDFSQKNYEPNYRPLEHKVIVEPWVFDGDHTTEYSFLCIAGKVRVIYASADRFSKYAVVNFDREWNELPYTSYDAVHGDFEKPQNLSEMISVAERLAKDFFLIRIDIYANGAQFKCGEITNCPGAAFCLFTPRVGELMLSRLLFAEVPDEAWDRFFSDA